MLNPVFDVVDYEQLEELFKNTIFNVAISSITQCEPTT